MKKVYDHLNIFRKIFRGNRHKIPAFAGMTCSAGMTYRHNHPLLFWIGAIMASLAILGISFYFYIAYLLVLPQDFDNVQQIGTTKIYDRSGQLLYEILQADSGKKSLIPLQQIPQNFRNATLAAEDINFYSHPGVDAGAILRAIIFNTREQRVVSGASTITQQLVRNLFSFGSKRGYPEKILEAMYAVRFSHIYSKDQVLELYLNKIYYGNMAYGSESAALDYFGKHIYDLDLAESALLAGLPQAPSYYNPFLYFDRAKKRQKYVLDQMLKYNFINEQDADAASKEPLKLRPNKVAMKAPHFVQYVINELDDMFGPETVRKGGLSVTTTLDYNLQLEAEGTVSRDIKNLHDKNVTDGALLAMDTHTGQILTWVGSENYFDDSIDGAVDMVMAERQPGSSIKPLTYLLSFEQGYTPADLLYDVPVQFQTETGPYTPKNYDLKYHGPVRFREALASSLNIPAVRLLDQLGIESLLSFLQKLGIQTLDKNPAFYGLALTLGGGEVRMIDMAGAFNIIANYGERFPFSTVLKVTDDSGKILNSWSMPASENVLGPRGKEHAYQIIDILKDPVARLKGFGEGSVLELSHEAAVKTGTTRNFRDNWTIGFTPDLLTAVWVGNADASAMQNISGVDGAGPIWHDFMEEALRSRPDNHFVRPPSLESVQICALSGKLPGKLCPETLEEQFVPGTQPTQADNYYQNFWVDERSGHIIPDQCLYKYKSPALKQKTFIVYPPELQSWVAENRLQLPPLELCTEYTDNSNGYTKGYPNTTKELPAIENPAYQDEYSIQGDLPLDQQGIPFGVIVPLETSEVTYILDGKQLAVVNESPFSYLWIPDRGEHSLKVSIRLANGTIKQSGEIMFIVK